MKHLVSNIKPHGIDMKHFIIVHRSTLDMLHTLHIHDLVTSARTQNVSASPVMDLCQQCVTMTSGR